MSQSQIETSRRDFLKSITAAAAGTQFLGLVTQQAHGAQLPSQMNIMIVITDQERPPMWFPANWEQQNLPNTVRLKNNGLTFNQAFCSTAMCTPSRNTFFTGLFPPQHHAEWTLTEDYQQTPIEPQLDPSLPNLATCLKEAGYDVIYKGKWHMSHGLDGVDGNYIEEDLRRYGFDGWNPPDAGGDRAITNFGGGIANNDGRFVDDAIAFLENRIQNPTSRPFCLIVSLINPHDVLGYPGTGSPPEWIAGGYDSSWISPTNPPISLPPSLTENLATNYKPTSHEELRNLMGVSLGPLISPQECLNYLNFYANLMKLIDTEIGRLLNVFDQAGNAGTTALNNTLIVRTSDHGECGLSHGRLRQKAFMTYEETLRIPMIWSNPVLYPTARTTDALISHVDFLPTLCALTNVPNWQAKGFMGVDYSSIIINPAASPVQDYVLFSFDDIYASVNAANFPDGAVAPPNRLRMIRTASHKYTRYYDKAGVEPDQQEFYDLTPAGGDYDSTHNLPLELRNLSVWAENLRIADSVPKIATPGQEAIRTTLMQDLAALETTRLAPRAYSPSIAPEDLKFEIKRWTDVNNQPQATVQITFNSRINTNYQLQKSIGLVTWEDQGPVVIGNNGLILMSDDLGGDKAFYRVKWMPASS